jgi:hypothetical protein
MIRKAKNYRSGQFSDALRSAGFESYPDYLKSEHWFALCARLRRKHPCCVGCGAKSRLVCHHVEYCRLGKERNSDLLVVCHDCHDDIHAKLDAKYPRKSTFFKARRTLEVFAPTITESAAPKPKKKKHWGHDRGKCLNRRYEDLPVTWERSQLGVPSKSTVFPTKRPPRKLHSNNEKRRWRKYQAAKAAGRVIAD